MKTFQFIIEGRVQGVSFRYYTVMEAQKHHIHGSVRNLDDGGVEVVAQGREEDMCRFEEYLARGPYLAHVHHVDKRELPGDHIFTDFDIVY